MSTVHDVVNNDGALQELQRVARQISLRARKSVWACLGDEEKGDEFNVTACTLSLVRAEVGLYKFTLKGRDFKGNFIKWTGQSDNIAHTQLPVGVKLATHGQQPLTVYI